MAKIDPEFLENQRNMYRSMLNSFARMNFVDFSPPTNSLMSYTKEDVQKALKDMSKTTNQQKLREISRSLYFLSSHYRSLINYYSTLYNFDFVVEAYNMVPDQKNIDKISKSYFKAVNSYEQMNIKYESLKVRAHAYIDGIFYGYAIKTKNGFYIQQFNPDNCQLSFINLETGLYGYSFDFSIFRNKEEMLNNYPDEFTTIYNYLKSTKAKVWMAKIESINAICIKPTVGEYAIPPLVGVFEDILDIYDFKALAKGKEEMGNYQLLSHQIPIRTDREADPDALMLSPEFVQSFHDNVAMNLPPNVGVLTTPMKLEPIKFERDTKDASAVTTAISQLWSHAGVSELLFGNSTSSTGLKMSITADESALTLLVDSFEKWVNEYAKVNFKGPYSFKCRILKTTRFNQTEYLDTRLKAAASGVPVKNEIIAVLGMTPSSAYLNAFIENDVLNLIEKYIPLQTSYTQTGDAENGRPTSDDGELTDAGEQNRENDSNEED